MTCLLFLLCAKFPTYVAWYRTRLPSCWCTQSLHFPAGTMQTHAAASTASGSPRPLSWATKHARPIDPTIQERNTLSNNLSAMRHTPRIPQSLARRHSYVVRRPWSQAASYAPSRFDTHRLGTLLSVAYDNHELRRNVGFAWAMSQV